nr:MAG TPA_asm: hypothetical protein [Caudoviricetes sp.]
MGVSPFPPASHNRVNPSRERRRKFKNTQHRINSPINRSGATWVEESAIYSPATRRTSARICLSEMLSRSSFIKFCKRYSLSAVFSVL